MSVRVLALLIVTGFGVAFAADKFVIDAELPAQNLRTPKGSTLESNLRTVQAGARDAEVIDCYIPAWCPNCPAWRKLFGDGDAAVKLVWIKENMPADLRGNSREVYPMFRQRSTGKVIPGDEMPGTLAGLREKFGIKAVSATVGAITVATVPRSEVETLKRIIGTEGRRKQGAAESITLGYGAKFAVTAGAVATWKTTAVGVLRIEADKPPKLEWGPVNQSCEWAEIRADEIYLSLPFAPDVRIGIE